jgi:hypothetical protein
MDNQSPPAEAPTTISYRLKRDAEDFVTRWRGWWQNKRFRLATYAASALFVLLFQLLFYVV